MQRNLLSVLLATIAFLACSLNLKAETISAVINGDWNTATTWGSGTIPTNLDDVIIPSGVTVTYAANSICKTLNVQGVLTGSASFTLTINGDLIISGTLTISQNTLAYNATINSGGSLLVSGTGKKLMLGTNSAESTFTNNGTIGSLTKGLYLEIYKSCPKLTLTGTTSVMPYFYSIRPDDIDTYVTGSSQEIVIDQNITILNTIGVVNSTSASKGNTRTLTINEGKTVTLGSASYFHSSYITDGLFNNNSFNAREAWVYNINGILDAATNSAFINLQTNINTSANTNNNTLTINVGSAGTLKCGEWISKREGLSTNIISVNVVAGGTITYSGTSYTSSQNATASTTFSVTNSLLTSLNQNQNFTNTSPVSLNGDISVSGNFTATKLVLEAGSKLTNNGNINVNTLNINSDAINGTGTFVDNGTSNIASANIQQYLTAGRNWYISCPLASSDGNVITGTTGNTLFTYDETQNQWATATGFSKGVGYVVTLGTTAEGIYTFTGGILNTGDQTITGLTRTTNVTESGFNLVGNPYPSYLDWLLASTNSPSLESTIWYRTQNSGSYFFATYNASGGQNTNGGSQYIPPMQAFWVKVAENQTIGTLAFTNSMRLHMSGTNRLKAPSVTSSTQQVLRLQVSNETNTDETVVYFDQNAEDGLDIYDSRKMANGDLIPDIFTLVSTNKLAINGLKSLLPNEEIPLGFTTGASNTFTIKATEIKNFDTDTKIILKDNLLNIEQDLTNGSNYSFTSDSTSNSSRFSIVFKSALTTNIQNNATEKQAFSIYKNVNNQITINLTGGSSRQGMLTICNTAGQKFINVPTTGSSTVLNTTFSSGVYLVTLNIDGKCSTKKFIIN